MLPRLSERVRLVDGYALARLHVEAIKKIKFDPPDYGQLADNLQRRLGLISSNVNLETTVSSSKCLERAGRYLCSID